MITEAMEVGVIVERRVLKNPWADHAWMPVDVLAGAPAAAPWTVLHEAPEATRYYAGAFQLEFFASETGMYRDNLHSGRPSLWISLRPSRTPPGVRLHLVTADPAEAEALTEPGTDVIEAVPMPPEIQKRLAAFVEAHHVERPFVKRKRDRADTEAMARRVPDPPLVDSKK
ncbi:DUF3305 domain-containing protein [Chelativorans alearense]|uniref:DUF3305 domain-containing protein n=1 Tax=Chelativorans alearense TaxID=2681495 RepID=UPI0013D4F4E7|nr:DUF3305 domain-containing protein [Chelativorans alearense]